MAWTAASRTSFQIALAALLRTFRLMRGRGQSCRTPRAITRPGASALISGFDSTMQPSPMSFVPTALLLKSHTRSSSLQTGNLFSRCTPPVAPSDPIQCHLCVVVRTWLCQSPSLPHACGAGLFADRPRRYGLCRGVVSDNGRLVASRGRDLRRNEAGITRSSPVLQFRRAHCVHACILHWHSRARRAARSITEKAQRL